MDRDWSSLGSYVCTKFKFTGFLDCWDHGRTWILDGITLSTPGRCSGGGSVNDLLNALWALAVIATPAEILVQASQYSTWIICLHARTFDHCYFIELTHKRFMCVNQMHARTIINVHYARIMANNESKRCLMANPRRTLNGCCNDTPINDQHMFEIF